MSFDVSSDYIESMPPRATASRGYHHGDLRQTLIDMTIEVVREKGIEGLSIRDVARKAGVSAGAPYRHFVDKQQLLAAVATDGFERLDAKLRKTLRKAGKGPLRRLEAVCSAYLDFARRNAEGYQVMFSSALSEAKPDSALSISSLKPFALLSESVAAVKRRSAPLDAFMLWSLGHGLATLDHAGVLARGPWRSLAKGKSDASSLATRRMLQAITADIS